MVLRHPEQIEGTPCIPWMASLDQTLQIFRALLGSHRDTGISEAEEAVWAYLTPIQGLHAQVEALDTLIREVEALNDTSPFLPILANDLKRHRERLRNPSG